MCAASIRDACYHTWNNTLSVWEGGVSEVQQRTLISLYSYLSCSLLNVYALNTNTQTHTSIHHSIAQSAQVDSGWVNSAHLFSAIHFECFLLKLLLLYDISKSLVWSIEIHSRVHIRSVVHSWWPMFLACIGFWFNKFSTFRWLKDLKNNNGIGILGAKDSYIFISLYFSVSQSLTFFVICERKRGISVHTLKEKQKVIHTFKAKVYKCVSKPESIKKMVLKANAQLATQKV